MGENYQVHGITGSHPCEPGNAKPTSRTATASAKANVRCFALIETICAGLLGSASGEAIET